MTTTTETTTLAIANIAIAHQIVADFKKGMTIVEDPVVKTIKTPPQINGVKTKTEAMTDIEIEIGI